MKTSLTNLFQALSQRKQRLCGPSHRSRRPLRQNRARLGMEALEGRTLMSVSAQFNWWMQDRFNIKESHDASYVQDVANNGAYVVNFNAGPTTNSTPADPIVSESWVIRTLDGKLVATMSGTTPHALLNNDQTYFVMLNVSTKQGQFSTVCQDITVRDILIVSVGDSAASGEGDPDTPGYYQGGTWHPPVWLDSQTDRSGHSAAAKAALAIEQADPHTSVTFVSVANSGDPTDPKLSNPQSTNPGVVGPGGQLDQVAQIVGKRQIDALIVTTGADDIGFSEIVQNLVECTPVNIPVVGTVQLKTLGDIQNDVTNPGPTPTWAHISLGQLPVVYGELNAAIQNKLGIPTQKVFITQYFDATHDANGQFVGGALGDIIPPFNVTKDAMAFGYNDVEVPLNNAVAAAAKSYGWNLVSGIADAFLTHGINAGAKSWVNTDEESRVAEGPVTPPSQADQARAAILAKFVPNNIPFHDAVVAGLYLLLKAVPDDAIVNAWDRMNTLGTAHPNDQGQQQIADILLKKLGPYLTQEANWNAPSQAGPFTVTQSGNAVTLAPNGHAAVGQTITLKQAPDVRQDFQIFLGGQIVYEAPVQGQQLILTGGGSDTFDVPNLSAGITVQLQAFQGLSVDVFNIDGTGAPITINSSQKGSATVNISPTTHDLTKIAGKIKVNGNAATSITVDDQADQGLQFKYTISSGELKSEYLWVNLSGFHWSPFATIDYHGGPSLNLHMSTNSNANEADVLSSPGNLNLWGGSNTTVNVCKISENLDGLGFLGVYSDDNAQTINWLDPQASLAKLRAPTVNIYDQDSAHAKESYTLEGFQLFRSAASQPTVEIDYDLGTHLSLYTGQVAGTVDVEGTPNATNITCGAADSISVTDNEAILGLLSLNGDGGSLTVTNLVQYPSGNDGVNFTQTANVVFDITDQQVNWHEAWHVTGVIPPDPEKLNPSHKDVHYDYRGQFVAGLAYTNLARITLTSSPGDTTSITVESTAPGTPVTVNAGTDGTKPNQFTIGHDGTVKDIQSQVTLYAAGAGDALTLDDSKANSTDVLTIANGQSGDVQVGIGNKDRFFGTGGSLDLNNLGSLTVSLSKAPSDVVHLSASKVTAFTINGDPSEFKGSGRASLDIDLGGAQDAVWNPGVPGAGSWTFSKGSHKTVTFSNMQPPKGA
jgi:hypothetical protein